MSEQLDRKELLRLIDRMVVGTISGEENERLEQMLIADPEARCVYFAYVDLDQGLRQIASDRSAEIPPTVGLSERPTPVRPLLRFPRLPLRNYAAVAAVSILVTGALFYWVARQRNGRSTDREAFGVELSVPHVATLVFCEGCRWQDANGPILEGQRLPLGELHLLQGVAMLRFDGGAVAVLKGDVRLDMESRGSVRLHYGRLTVRAPDEAVGFTVRTPVSDVTDLGTEFAVDVERSGSTEIHVLDGEVEYKRPAGHPGSGHLLRDGEAVRVEQSPSKSRTVQVKAKRLDQLLREAKPRAREDLMWVYEGFQYDPGSLPLDAAAGGKGWAGPWRLRGPTERGANDPDSTGDLLIAFQKLPVPWPIRGGRAGMLEMPPGKNYRLRQIVQPIDLSRDAVSYVSMMMREEAVPSETQRSTLNDACRLTLRSSEEYWSDRISFGSPEHGKPHIELADFIRFTGPQIQKGQSQIWVAKIVSRHRGEDEISFRIYQEGESLDFVEPAEWSIVSREVRSDARLDVVVLTSAGDTRRWFDELRIGTSWRAVIPIDRKMKIEFSE